jgi:hypothetical protein
VTISVTPSAVSAGQSATLTWSSANATSCSATDAWSGSQATSGSLPVTPSTTGSFTYGLTCTGPAGSTSGSATLTVYALPTVTISFTPSSISVGQMASLNWFSMNATSCVASGSWSGAQQTSGTFAVAPSSAGSGSYTITCDNAAGGSGSGTATLAVTAPPPPSNSSGGGALGLATLCGLVGLAFARRRRFTAGIQGPGHPGE